MKTKFTFFIIALCLSVMPIFSQTNLSGYLSDTDTLKTGSGDYYVTGTYYINANDSLVIEPGVNIYFKDNARIIVRGKLYAQEAFFTSDPAFNQKGYWRYIEIGDNSFSGYAELNECIVSNGGRDGNGMIYAYNGTVDITGCTLESASNAGIVINTRGTVNIKESVINDSSWPVTFLGPGQFNDLGLNNYYGNTHDAVYINFYNLYANWDLPLLFLTDATGTEPQALPYVFVSYFTIKEGYTLDIAPGCILKSSNWLYVEGRLNAVGTADNMIYFTSDRNDNIGGDTNANGSGNVPAPGAWGGVWFKSTSSASSSMKYCDISFGGKSNHGGLVVEQSNPSIDNCSFSDNIYGAEFRSVAKPVFTNNTLASSKVVPIAMSFDSDPVFTNNQFSASDNEYDAIGLLDGKLAANSTLKKRNFTDIENVTFLMLGSLTIPEDFTLTIEPGVVIKSRANYIILVQGGLVADATEDAPIVFTSSKDDFHGNPLDTNKDGSQTDPNYTDWSGIMFETTSNDNCKLDYTKVKYASMQSRWYGGVYIGGGAITMENSSPSITNSVIQDSNHGIYIYQASKPIIKNNEIFNTRYTPIAISVLAEPVFADNKFINTAWTALGIIDQYVGLNGKIPVRNIAGFDNITYVLMNDMTINSGSTVKVDPSVVLKFNSSKQIIVNGGLEAMGHVSATSTDSITFTSLNDDNFGNPSDTRNDGDATSPKSGDWRRIQFTGTAIDATNHLSYCNFLFGGSREGTLVFTDAGNEVSHSLISDSKTYGIRCEGSASPIFTTDVRIQNCTNDPIAMSLTSNPTFSDESPVFKSMGNGSNGIKILEGNLSSDATLITRNVGGIQNVAYIVDRLTIKANSTLTIAKGVVIKFSPNGHYGITVEGALKAVGTDDEKITFTSIHDDNKGGDTNDNGNATQPDRGNWWDIYFKASNLSDENILENCEVFYGGSGYSWANYTNYGAVRVYNSYVKINKTRIEHSNTSGVGVFGSANPVITNNEINNIRYTPITLSMFSNPTFANNNCDNIGIFALGLAKENYSTDATIPMRNFGGYLNIPYYFYDECQINSGTTLTIKDSLTFKSKNKNMFIIKGGLKVKGNDDMPVVFTHEYDDEYGNPGDTNEDGLIQVPTNSNGTALVFEDISNDDSCEVSGAIFRHMKNGIVLNQAAPKIESCTFAQTQWGIVLNGVSLPSVNKNEFNDLTYTPLLISLVSYPRSTVDNVITGSTWHAIGVIPEELVQDATLEQKTFAGIENIPYYFSGNYTVGTSVTLSIAPGVVCKFNQYTQLNVQRGLMAMGGPEAENLIVFTDYRDDFYGGDTNRDGAASEPDYRRWKGIKFSDEALDELCNIDYAIIRYAGWSQNDAAITTVASSPKISNTSITKASNGIRATLSSNPLIVNCDLYELTYFGVNNINKAFDIKALNCWWGHDSGPYHDTKNPLGEGSPVSDMVSFDPWETQGVLNPLMGDVSLNGIIQAYDASLILQADVGSLVLNLDQERVADVDGNNLIQAYDASLVQQFVVGTIDVFPAEKSATMFDPAEFVLNAPVMNDDQTFYLPVSLNSESEVVSIGITASYDAANLELIGVIRGADSKNMMMAYHRSFEEVKVAMAGIDALPSESEVLLFHFRNLHPEESYRTDVKFEQLIANTDDVSPYAQNTGFEIEGSATQLSHPSLSRFEVYPNPSHGAIHIRYSLKKDVEAEIALYNLAGQKVRTLFHELRAKGDHTYHFNEPLEPGVYFVRFTSENRIKYRKISIR